MIHSGIYLSDKTNLQLVSCELAVCYQLDEDKKLNQTLTTKLADLQKGMLFFR